MGAPLLKIKAFENPTCRDGCPVAAAQDNLAEQSKAVAKGAIPQGRGFEPHSCHLATVNNHTRKIKQYTWPGSNWRPSACEADVIATRPQVLAKALLRFVQSVLSEIFPRKLHGDAILHCCAATGQFARVVKGVDLRSTASNCAWVRTPQLA